MILDIETTGLCTAIGHRIAETAAIGLVDRRGSGRYFHVHPNPERAIDPGFAAILGRSQVFLQDKPHFSEVAKEFTAFMDGAILVARDAPFDPAFIDRKHALIGRRPVKFHGVAIVDSRAIARELRRGPANSLDVLCAAPGITAACRNLRSVRLDTAMPAEVFLKLTA